MEGTVKDVSGELKAFLDYVGGRTFCCIEQEAVTG